MDAIFTNISEILNEFEKFKKCWVQREENRLADRFTDNVATNGANLGHHNVQEDVRNDLFIALQPTMSIWKDSELELRWMLIYKIYVDMSLNIGFYN